MTSIGIVIDYDANANTNAIDNDRHCLSLIVIARDYWYVTLIGVATIVLLKTQTLTDYDHT